MNARIITGALIGGYIGMMVLFGHAEARDPPLCHPLNATLQALVGLAAKSGATLTPIAPADMPSFISTMKKGGIEIEGDAALVWKGKNGAILLWVRRGDQLCVVPPMAPTGVSKDEGTIDGYGRGWVLLGSHAWA